MKPSRLVTTLSFVLGAKERSGVVVVGGGWVGVLNLVQRKYISHTDLASHSLPRDKSRADKYLQNIEFAHTHTYKKTR